VQCHIEGESDFIGEVAVIPNTFAGLEPLLGGERSFEGAPPTMPHELFMRTNCIACHGSQGYSGLITDHPERRNCIQCHTPTSFLMN
jgi:cytochrome c-type protein NapB